MSQDEKKVSESEQTKAGGKHSSSHHSIYSVVSFTLFSCQHSHTAVLQHDKLIKCHGNGVGVWEQTCKHNSIFRVRSGSNKLSSGVVEASWAFKPFLKHDPDRVGDLQDNWPTREVKGQAKVLVPAPVLKLIHKQR